MRISDWSSDVCSSDLAVIGGLAVLRRKLLRIGRPGKSLRPDADTDRRDLVEPPANLGMQALRRLRQGLERILDRSEERRVGKEGGSSGISRRSRYHLKKRDNYTMTHIQYQ